MHKSHSNQNLSFFPFNVLLLMIFRSLPPEETLFEAKASKQLYLHTGLSICFVLEYASGTSLNSHTLGLGRFSSHKTWGYAKSRDVSVKVKVEFKAVFDFVKLNLINSWIWLSQSSQIQLVSYLKWELSERNISAILQ